MIALSGCIGKTYNLILVERLTTYLTVNKFVDPALQKAFLPGINGTIEHNIVMEELNKDAKAKNHTLHSTFFDLEDAFGRVPHGLIEDALTRHFLPQNIITYFHNSYTNSKAVVQTKEWRSSPFPFKRGVFQGDHISPIIFLMTFNPIIQSLQNQSQKFGYKLGDFSYVTLPYADDFCLISTHKTSHQNLINQIQSQVSSMGLKLKPSKCRSFSVSGGKPKDVPFYIEDYRIPSIKGEEQKFLGKLLFFKGKPEETFTMFKNIISEGIENIEKAEVKN